jgi:ribosomal protein L11 methyltransferase
MNLPADPSTSPSGYQRWSLELPAELEDPLAAELWGCGTLGIEVREKAPGRIAVDAYFPDPPPAALDGFDLESWHRRGVERLAVDPFAARDWLAEYRAVSVPIEVGRRFRIDPRDVDDGAAVGAEVEAAAPTPGPDGRYTLRIPARSAFGTGSHESTRLALRWLEELDLAGRSVLDVGCGSGVLAFAAELLGAARVVGFDADPQAALLAAQNARWNGLSARFFAGRVAALRAAAPCGGAFDVALVNVLPERIAGELPALLRRLHPGARVVSSGNLAERRGELLGRLAGLGLELEGELVEGEWVAFLLRSAADDAGGER